MARAAGDLRTMAPGGAALLVAATAVHVVVRVRSFAVAVPGLSSGRAFVASEAGVAASSSLIGGGMVAAGLKTSMLRSWAVAPEAIAVSLAATGVATSAATWSLAIAVSAASLAAGTGTAVHAVVTVAGGVILVAAGVFWAFVLCHDGTGGRVVWLGERTLAVVRRRVRACPDPDVAAWFGRGRHCGRQLVGTRGLGIFGLTALSQVLLGAVLVVAVGVVGVRGPGVLEVFTAFALVRVLATLAPLPGGLGVTEVGLVALLVDAGGSAPTALAAVMAFRGCTFVVPIVSGAACAAGWHWSSRGRRRRPSVADPGQVTLVAAPG